MMGRRDRPISRVERDADEALFSSGALPPKVLTVKASAGSSWRDLRRLADSVGVEVRKLEADGYDVRHVEASAILVRSDVFVTPGPDSVVSILERVG
jgi:hypothetical protein